MKIKKGSFLLSRPVIVILAIILAVLAEEIFINTIFVDDPVTELILFRLFILLAVIAPSIYFLLFLPLLRNMSALSKAEAELRQSEEKYRNLLHEMNEGFCLIEMIFDDQGKAVNLRFLETTHEFENQSGLKDVKGKLLLDIEPVIEESWFEIYGRVAKTGVEEHFEKEAKGLGRFFEIHAYPYGNPGENRLAVMFNDITSRKHAEAVLRESELRWVTTLSSIGDAVIATNESGEINFMNREAEKLTGWTLREARQKTFTSVLRLTNEKTGKEVEYTADKIILEKIGPFLAEGSLLISKDGTSIPIDNSGSPILTEDGIIMGAVITFRDITEKRKAEKAVRESEERLSALINATSDVAFRMSPDWSEMSSLNGGKFLSSVEKPSQDWLNKFIPVNTQPFVLNAFHKAIETKSMFELEHEVIRADGSIGWTYSRAIPVLDEKREIIEWNGIASDFTDRKQNEKALRESEEKYRSLLNEMNRGFCLLGLVFDDFGIATNITFLEFNKEFEKIFGIRDNQISNMSIQMGRELTDIFGRINRTGFPEHFEWFSAGKYFDINGYSYGGTGSGKVALLMSDITERKKTEIQLRHSEERFSKAFHNMAIPATIMRVSDNILTDVNSNFLDLFKYSRSEVIGHTSKELKLFADFNERMKTLEIMNSIGHLRDYEIDMLTKNRKKLNFLVSSQVVTIREQKHFLTTYFNITERKEYERKLGHFSAIIQYSEVAIISKDLNGNIQTWNIGAEKIYGYPAEEIIGQNITVLEVPGEPIDFENLVNRILNNEKIESFEINRRRKEGTIIPVIVNLSPIRTVSGEIIGISSISQDISEQKKAEEVLRAKDRAEAADKMKTNFLLTMSHELRTPLNSIIGFSGILLKHLAGPLNNEQEIQLEMIRNSGQHLLSLINDILDITKINEGKIVPVYEIFDFQELIDEVQNIVRPFAESKDLSITLIKDPVIGKINSDKKRVSQILINLLNNAIKFTEKGSVKITCCLDDHTIFTEVSDTGIGIRKTDLEKLFNPFMQLENKYTRKYEGSGLGLSITKKLLDLLGGTIKVNSEPGIGSTFTFTLPVNKAA